MFRIPTATSAQDVCNPFADEGVPEKEPKVKEVVATISCVAETLHSVLIKGDNFFKG